MGRRARTDARPVVHATIVGVTISDLGQLLRSMEPTLRDGEFVFVSAVELPADVEVEASVREDEGP